MNKNEHIEIRLSKTKLALTLLGCFIFIGVGVWLMVNPTGSTHRLFSNPTIQFGAGIASVLFFGLIAVTMSRKVFNKKPGLTINYSGITDNASGVAAGFIPWTDIQEITVAQVMNQKFLMLIVINPQDYIDRVANPLKRNAMKMNYKSYGSPISIAANALQTDFDTLQQLLIDKMNEYKS